MPSCLLTIEFYRPGRQYHDGEKVTGWIRVEVERNVRCRNLHLAARWSTSGKTDVASRVYHQVSLFEGVWKPGEKYEYAFEFEPPAGPFTYRGRNFELNHLVSVWADLPWTIETRQEKGFDLVPDHQGNRNPVVATPLPAARSPARTGSESPSKELLISSCLLLASAILVFKIGAWALVGVAAALVVAALGFRHTLPRSALPDLRWDFPDSMTPGLPCLVRLDSGRVRWTRIRGVEVTLCGYERTRSGARDRRECFEAALFRQSWVMDISALNQDNSTSGVSGSLHVPVPEGSAWSVDLPGAQVVWEIRTLVRLGWWPDFRERHEVFLIPCGHRLPSKEQANT